MNIPRKKFVIIFLVAAAVFQFITNSVLGTEVGLFPRNGEWFPGAGSPAGWKDVLATIVYPVKFVLIGPLTFLGQDPDPPPPFCLRPLLRTGLPSHWFCIFYSPKCGPNPQKSPALGINEPT